MDYVSTVPPRLRKDRIVCDCLLALNGGLCFLEGLDGTSTGMSARLIYEVAFANTRFAEDVGKAWS